MTLRRRDDWDDALEEAYCNAWRRGELASPSRVVYADLKAYGRVVYVDRLELLGLAGYETDRKV